MTPMQWMVFAILLAVAACGHARRAAPELEPLEAELEALLRAEVEAEGEREALEALEPRNGSMCQAAGRFCLGCGQLGLCIEAHPGDFVQYVVDNCTGNYTCSESLKGCSAEKESLCKKPSGQQALKCQDGGLWPDPFECNVYWRCGIRDPPESDYDADARLVCHIGYAFDPRTSNCSLQEAQAPCGEDEYPLPPCDPSKVTAGPSKQDPNLYYVCVGGVTNLFRCREGFVYDGDTWECKRQNGTDPEPITPLSFDCPGVGRFPDPDNCYKYYECSDTANPHHAACVLGKYFSSDKQACKVGVCPYNNNITGEDAV